ncbi:unnamed protein product [Vicia faba]|uniref:Uncharacterized protein n=1 Tax=Vicia faba TaxID=3906 RepID=A0AAV1B791_VICFA|nr:unnamed protein product [Vicia faba]
MVQGVPNQVKHKNNSNQQIQPSERGKNQQHKKANQKRTGRETRIQIELDPSGYGHLQNKNSQKNQHEHILREVEAKPLILLLAKKHDRILKIRKNGNGFESPSSSSFSFFLVFLHLYRRSIVELSLLFFNQLEVDLISTIHITDEELKSWE